MLPVDAVLQHANITDETFVMIKQVNMIVAIKLFFFLSAVANSRMFSATVVPVTINALR